MTSPPSPPNRRRRRIVVITIAVLVLGLGWWFWPRVDQRFVGTWDVFDIGDGDALPICRISLRRNGRFEMSAKSGVPGSSWRVEKGELVLGKTMPSWADPIAPYAESVWEGFTGHPLPIGEQRWEIVELYDNEIVLEGQFMTTRDLILKRHIP